MTTSTVLAGDLARPLQRKNSSLESPFPAEIDENDARDRRDSAQPDEPLLKSERLRNAGRRNALAGSARQIRPPRPSTLQYLGRLPRLRTLSQLP
ncbi:hypothetical protein RTBOTA2_004216 [Rhodotorula toruloides]|nr:hypothetical protein RTBOTA2_004216 [Rhodotorula toruloides]